MARLLGLLGSPNARRPNTVEVEIRHLAARYATVTAVPTCVTGDGFAAGTSGNGEGAAAASGPVSVAWIGRPKLNATSPAASGDLSRAIMAKFASVGADVLDELTGPFALAIFDAERRRGLIATDRMGMEPIFALTYEGGLAFGSSPTDLPALAGMPIRLSPQAIFDYLFCHVIPAPRAIVEGPRRLMPGECIEFDQGRTTIRRYWQARFDEPHGGDFGSLRERFIDVLRASVGDAMSGASCGAFLSGGTDSSTIAGLMTQLGGRPARTFSIGFDAAGFDEMEYARLASRHFGTEHHEYYVTQQDIVDAVPRLASGHSQPFGNSSALPTYFCARLARDNGVERLLGGDGGDELFGGNARYAKQYVFSLYERIPAGIREHALEPACTALGRAGRLPIISKVVSYVEQASVPMPQRLESYNLLTRLGADRILTGDFLSQVDTTEPLRLNEEAYFNPSARSLINRMLALDFKTTLADNDLPKVMQSCELAGLPVVFPMLDPRVVDFSLGLPPAYKLKGTQLRFFFKEALRGFLPDEIIRKKKHGFGLPFGEWTIRHAGLRDLTFDALGSLKHRGWIRPQFIDELRQELMPAHPNYYGTIAWVLMMLELWLQRHHDSPGVATRGA